MYIFNVQQLTDNKFKLTNNKFKVTEHYVVLYEL